MEKIKDYFARYPNNDEVYEKGGVLFHTRGAADSYGNAKETVRHTRAKAMATPIVPEGGNDDAEKLEATKTAAIELLKATDVDALDYNAMKALAKDLQLTTADKKAETLKVALAEYKTTLTVE